ncbi:unnamed protein product [Pleuronectes platessa]|uniref:Uncharacterized protein n=1 Tax=Pleuronectes platessa TaxID=8262 RepID=A0A9N7YKA5_PLEPL|nr:unnamed protein product [Pleuronectes platessa]
MNMHRFSFSGRDLYLISVAETSRCLSDLSVLRTQIHLLVFLVGGRFRGQPTPRHYIRSRRSAQLHRERLALRVRTPPHAPAMPSGLDFQAAQPGSAHLLQQCLYTEEINNINFLLMCCESALFDFQMEIARSRPRVDPEQNLGQLTSSGGGSPTKQTGTPTYRAAPLEPCTCTVLHRTYRLQRRVRLYGRPASASRLPRPDTASSCGRLRPDLF